MLLQDYTLTHTVEGKRVKKGT